MAFQMTKLGPYKVKVIATTMPGFKPTRVVYVKTFYREDVAAAFGSNLALGILNTGGASNVSQTAIDLITSRLKSSNSSDARIIMTGRDGVLLANFGDRPGQHYYGYGIRGRLPSNAFTDSMLAEFGETTQVYQANTDAFLDIGTISRKFAMMDLPDGSYVEPLWIESDGIPPNSYASQEQSPLVDGPNEDGMGALDQKTGMWLGIGLVGVALYFLIQSTRG